MSIKTVAFLPHKIIIYNITALKNNHWHAKSELKCSDTLGEKNHFFFLSFYKKATRHTKMIKCLKLSFEKWPIFYFSSPFKCIWHKIFYKVIRKSFQNDEKWRLLSCDSTFGCRVIQDDLWHHIVDTKWCKITKNGTSLKTFFV